MIQQDESNSKSPSWLKGIQHFRTDTLTKKENRESGYWDAVPVQMFFLYFSGFSDSLETNSSG